MKYLVAALLVFSITACQKFPDKQKEIDGLIFKADSSWVVYQSLDTTKHGLVYEAMMKNLKFLEVNLRPEYITRKQAIHELSDYRGIRKVFKKGGAYQQKLEEELPHRIQQLKDLKKDVANGHFESVDKINEAISDEEARLLKAIDQLNFLVKLPEGYRIKNKIEPFIDSLVQAIKNKETLE